jgi:OFA family oxalate/formate antiporter-like MFS transporter
LKKPFYGWIIVGVAFLIGVTESGAFQAILAIFMKPMANEFGWSRAAISGAIAIGSLSAALLSPFIGPVLDRHGPRMTAFWGILFLSLGLVGMTFVNRIWQLYLFFGMGRMIAVGILLMVISVSVSNWFIRKRGRAMGIASLGPRLGSVLLPLLAQFFILVVGWRLAWSSLGIIVFLMSGIPVLLFLRHRPEGMGLLPDGDAGISKEVNPCKPADNISAAAFAPAYKYSLTGSQAIRTSTFWLLTTVDSLIPFVQAGINFHIYPFLTDCGIAPMTAVLVLAVINFSGAFGSISWGVFAEKINVKILLAVNVFFSSLLFLAIYWTALLQASGHTLIGMLFLLSVFYGVTYGGRAPLLNIIWADFFGRHSLGSILGYSSPFRLTANAVGPIFAAVFYDIYGSYKFPFYFFAVSFFIAGFICINMRAPKLSENPERA